MDVANGVVVLVRPKRARLRAVLDFVVSRSEWIRERLRDLPPRIAFTDGTVIPLHGVDHVVRFAPTEKRGVWREDTTIHVAGHAEHAPRRARDWMKAEAKRILTPMVHQMAENLGCKAAHISVRDTVSRWGSCSPDGKLSFSWRLIFAPRAVLAYVAAHEVAHLKHLNHGRAFWRTVESVLESYSDATGPREVALARQWLRRRGATLHRYG